MRSSRVDMNVSIFPSKEILKVTSLPRAHPFMFSPGISLSGSPARTNDPDALVLRVLSRNLALINVIPQSLWSSQTYLEIHRVCLCRPLLLPLSHDRLHSLRSPRSVSEVSCRGLLPWIRDCPSPLRRSLLRRLFLL